VATKTLKVDYKEKILPEITKELAKKNLFQVPRLEKVKVSIGVGKIARKGGSSNSMDDAKMKAIEKNLTDITGQKPVIHNAKKSVSNFKIREGMPIGMSVTLRGERMLDFLSRFVDVTLPRVRDFRGIEKKFDGNGNYSVGLKDFTVFPEVQPEQTEFVHGVEITVVTSSNSDEEGRLLLTKIGFPFKK
jgi:large subunit ribosomal protein L5